VHQFLTANWRYLAMLNYVVDPRILVPLVPPSTEIDYENGETFVSIVGFLFLDTRLLGLPIPLRTRRWPRQSGVFLAARDQMGIT
jgi:uncharacterized protein YqjF (DUF2071 family)